MTSTSPTKRTRTKHPKDITELTRLYEESKNNQHIASAHDKIRYCRAIEKGKHVDRYSPKTLELQKEVKRLRAALSRRQTKISS